MCTPSTDKLIWTMGHGSNIVVMVILLSSKSELLKQKSNKNAELKF